MLDTHGAPLRFVHRRLAITLLTAVTTIYSASDPARLRADEPDNASSKAGQSIRLAPTDSPSPALVKVVFEVDGKLLDKPEKSTAETPEHALKALGNYLYEERILDIKTRQSARFYQQASSEISIDRRPHQLQLREDRKYVIMEPDRRGSVFRSPQGPLLRPELELIEVPGGSNLVDQLLPGREVALGETWTHSEDLLARLLNLDSVSVNDVTSELIAIEQDQAKISLSGKLVGSTAGVITELDLKAKYNVDLGQSRVVWLAMGIGESRAPGLMQPGLRVQARVRMLVEPGSTPHLTPESLDPVVAGEGPRGDLLEYQPESGRFLLTHDRRWHLYSERPELTVLRLIENDQLVAQCNVRALTGLADGQSVTLAQFQAEIRKALGSAAQQIVDARESTMPNGLRQLRVAVVGQVANTPIQWIYYQINDQQQHRLTCVFTMSGEAVSRFGTEDLTIVDSIRLLDQTTPAETAAVEEEAIER